MSLKACEGPAAGQYPAFEHDWEVISCTRPAIRDVPETQTQLANSRDGPNTEDALCGAQVEEELTELGLSKEAMDGIVAATRIGNLEELQQLLGEGNEASQELQQLFDIAEGYGIAEYLQLDTSCVRGLAYYTGKHSARSARYMVC